MRDEGLGEEAGVLTRLPVAGADPIRTALVESRQRWQGLVALAADFAYETDANGCLVFVTPEEVLGWRAEALLGQPAGALLASPAVGFNPFAPGLAARNQRVWLRRADGGLVCYAMACTPLEGGGSRGLGQDITAQDVREAATAAALRRGEVLDHILWRMRQEVLASRMMQAVLEALMGAMGAQGAAVINLLAEADSASVLHQAGEGVEGLLPTIQAMLLHDNAAPQVAPDVDGCALLACPSFTRFGERAALTLWRRASGRQWDADDKLLASSATAIIRVVLEHETIQRELARQARTDPLTGLLNRRSFLEEIFRRIERLDREALPGTLMFVDLDFFKALNDACGHEVGDEALTLAAQMLRETVRPTDLVARLGGDEFAVWMDGSDELTAAERAEHLKLGAPSYFARELPAGVPPLSMSIGIACRRAGDFEDLEALMRRADGAMYEVKRNGRGHWKVAQDGFFP